MIEESNWFWTLWPAVFLHSFAAHKTLSCILSKFIVQPFKAVKPTCLKQSFYRSNIAAGPDLEVCASSGSDTLHLGCSYHLHPSHHFLSTVVRLCKKKSKISKIWEYKIIKFAFYVITKHKQKLGKLLLAFVNQEHVPHSCNSSLWHWCHVTTHVIHIAISIS